MTKEEFIRLWGEEALKRYSKEKVLPSLVICQAILETGWGTTDKAKQLNNYHGIKWYNDSVCRPYKAINCKTWEEYTPGTITNIDALFCKFDNIQQELDCYYSWLHRPNPNYTALHGCTDAMKTFDYINASPYATDTQYGVKLKRIYNENPLIRTYDEKALKPVQTTKTEDYSLNTIPNRFKVKVNNIQKGAYTNYKNACIQANNLHGIVIDGTNNTQIYPNTTTEDYTKSTIPERFKVRKDGVQLGSYTYYNSAVALAKSKNAHVYDSTNNMTVIY